MKLAVTVSGCGRVWGAIPGYGVTWDASVTETKRDLSYLVPGRHHNDRGLRESEVKAGKCGIACQSDDGMWVD